MKKFFLILFVFAAGIFMMSCEKELPQQLVDETDQLMTPVLSGAATSNSMDDEVEQYPEAIQAYVDANYAGLIIVEVEAEEDDDNPDVAYEVELSDGTELYFDADGNFLFMDDEEEDESLEIDDEDVDDGSSDDDDGTDDEDGEDDDVDDGSSDDGTDDDDVDDEVDDGSSDDSDDEDEVDDGSSDDVDDDSSDG